MKVKFYCPQWGSALLPYKVFFTRVKEAGFDGVEMSLPFEKKEKSEILHLLKDFELELVAQHWETSHPDPLIHREVYRNHLINLAEANPVFINSQTGKDYFPFEENAALIAIAFQVEKETGIPVIHETHRGKFSFALHITRQYLDKIPRLNIGLDLSHWCNVSESLLADQQDDLEVALGRTRHIHARVGYAEGPQITDPRLPEWEEAVNVHLSAWDKVVSNLVKNGRDCTITPEFGPHPYMLHLPFTQMPVANQWEINVYMKDLLKERYSSVK
ncbi:MAG: sugar phosphate isomerase/epimerase [Bacteroidales bacterium]|nr:sugar phosphate isomerase/epimerase [Bacteroidales bacterium]